jgi:transcriptional regulator with XRE-family HTH domain
MKFDGQNTDTALLKLLGERIAGVRLGRNLTQAQVAEQAGLGLRTVQRLELGATATRLSGFLRVCRVLGLVENFESLIPEPPISPIAQLKLQGKKRQRAARKTTRPSKPRAWTWGESR